MPPSLNAEELRRLRLRSLLLDPNVRLSRTLPKPAKPGSTDDAELGCAGIAAAWAQQALKITEWFGAMQAQDLSSGKWSYGVRLPGGTEADIDAAIESGLILRTWPMRGTIHFVPAQDARWMLAHFGSKTMRNVERRWEYLGINPIDLDQMGEILESELRGGKRLSRSRIMRLWTEAGLDVNGQRGYHTLWYLSQTGLTCIGPQEGKEQTFVLLEEWAGDQRRLDADEAMAELALRYFRSHGPAPHQDFMGWAGINAKEARKGIAACGNQLAQVQVEGRNFWMAAAAADTDWGTAAAAAGSTRAEPVGLASSTSTFDQGEILVLPGFDEFVLGYKDRGFIVEDEFRNQIVPGGNGVFRPTIVEHGRVIGTWSRQLKSGRVRVESAPFRPLSSEQEQAFRCSIRSYAKYLSREPSFG